MINRIFWTPDMLAALQADYAAGLSARASAKHIGVARETVLKKRRELNLPSRHSSRTRKCQVTANKERYARLIADPVRSEHRRVMRRIAEARRSADPEFRVRKLEYERLRNARRRKSRQLPEATA